MHWNWSWIFKYGYPQHWTGTIIVLMPNERIPHRHTATDRGWRATMVHMPCVGRRGNVVFGGKGGTLWLRLRLWLLRICLLQKLKCLHNWMPECRRRFEFNVVACSCSCCRCCCCCSCCCVACFPRHVLQQHFAAACGTYSCSSRRCWHRHSRWIPLDTP